MHVLHDIRPYSDQAAGVNSDRFSRTLNVTPTRLN